jgi:hypothetical protein
MVDLVIVRVEGFVYLTQKGTALSDFIPHIQAVLEIPFFMGSGLDIRHYVF